MRAPRRSKATPGTMTRSSSATSTCLPGRRRQLGLFQDLVHADRQLVHVFQKEQLQFAVDAVGDDDPLAAASRGVGQRLPRADFGAHVDINHHRLGGGIFRLRHELVANDLAQGLFVSLGLAIGVGLLADGLFSSCDSISRSGSSVPFLAVARAAAPQSLNAGWRPYRTDIVLAFN